MGILEWTESRHVEKRGVSKVSDKKKSRISEALGVLAGKPQPSMKMRDGAGYPIPAVRRGKKAIMGWFDPIVGDQLRELSYEKRIPQQALLREALNMLFKKHGKPEIA
jgi:hypothetical protein